MRISTIDHPDEPAALSVYRKRVAAQHVSFATDFNLECA
jgi:hypothetical protein